MLAGHAMTKESTQARVGLERSCERPTDWIAGTGPVAGVELFRARLAGRAYAKHRHDTYAIGLTDCGVQVFDYRGAAHASTAGRVVVLHPDESHDGRAGTDDVFGYRIVYVQPSRIAEAVRTLSGRARPLPFVREPVSANARLARAVRDAFADELTPLTADDLVVALAEGLLEGARDVAHAPARRIDVPAVERARRFLDAEKTRVVESSELEAITGLTRYALARQFRAALGTSPYRYLLMRRLELAKRRMLDGRALAEVAGETGFADQAHFTRAFTSAFGLAPGRYRALRRP
ncbi:MAG TPA: AraC family transcriptional regulator [Methylomirabilota bacterium]|nr:AraC family transcriptional regulator [Methylomirabilota bacterium]